MKKVVLNGSSGRMGKEILQILKKDNLSVTECNEGKKASDKIIKGNDVLIDFSSVEGFEESLKSAIKTKTPFLSGPTGLKKNQLESLEQASRTIPVLWAANMSLGVAVLKKAIRLLSELEDFDYQIEEFHHNKKKDKPSGTAISLQQTLSHSLNKAQRSHLAEPVSVRAGGIAGIHKVYAVSENEMLCFEHQALSRQVFAEGAVRAARWLVNQKPGLYKIEDVLNGE
jgi:4-hydroxy-tetrahydrodipicolinate reductase